MNTMENHKCVGVDVMKKKNKKDRSELKPLKRLEKKVIKLMVKREKLNIKLKKLFEKTEDGVI